MDRADTQSYGVTETGVLVAVLGPDGLTSNRRADLIKAVKQREALISDVPLELRVLYHALYEELKPDNEDVWFKVGLAAGWPEKTAKDRAWRRAHPRGRETEPTATSGTTDAAAGGEISD